jgi:hypothetical protein
MMNWKECGETIVDYFKILSHNLPVGTEKSHEAHNHERRSPELNSGP